MRILITFGVTLLLSSITPAFGGEPAYKEVERHQFGQFIAVQYTLPEEAVSRKNIGIREKIVITDEAGNVVWERSSSAVRFYDNPVQKLIGGDSEELIIYTWSGGMHCCFDFYIFAASKEDGFKQIGLIPGGNCDGLRIEDLDGDGKKELVSCDNSFEYFHVSFVDSPLMPVVYTYQDGMYVDRSSAYPSVYLAEIKAAKKELTEFKYENTYSPYMGNMLRILLSYIYMDKTKEGWDFYDKNYKLKDKAEFKRDIKRRLREVKLAQ